MIFGVHQMRFPREKHDPRLVPHRPLHLGQHARLARLDELPVAKAKCLFGNHFLDVRIGGRARFHAIDPGVKLVCMLDEVGERMPPLQPQRSPPRLA